MLRLAVHEREGNSVCNEVYPKATRFAFLRNRKNKTQIGFSQSGSKLKLLEIRRHRIVLVCFACLASAPDSIVLADGPPFAFLALAPYRSVLADARPSALLALVPYPSVLADARPSAILARAPSPKMLADLAGIGARVRRL